MRLRGYSGIAVTVQIASVTLGRLRFFFDFVFLSGSCVLQKMNFNFLFFQFILLEILKLENIEQDLPRLQYI